MDSSLQGKYLLVLCWFLAIYTINNKKITISLLKLPLHFFQLPLGAKLGAKPLVLNKEVTFFSVVKDLPNCKTDMVLLYSEASYGSMEGL